MAKSGKKELKLEQNTKETEEKKKTEEILSFLSQCDIVMWCWHFFLVLFFLSFGGKLIIDGVNIAGVGKGRKLNLGKTTWPVTLKRFWQKLQNHQEAAWLSG